VFTQGISEGNSLARPHRKSKVPKMADPTSRPRPMVVRWWT
jgi:hypothetical protein